jgi:hypothetical protein
MSSARTAGLPPRARQLLEVLYEAVLEEPALRAAVDRERWIDTVRAEYKAWRASEAEGARGAADERSGVAIAEGADELEAKVEARQDAEHAIARIALETLAEQALLARSADQDLRPRLPRERAVALLADLDPVDLEMYRRCELDLERASRVARRTGLPRDEVLRRWSRTRQALLERVREA